MLLHRFLQEFQRGLLVSGLRHDAIKDLTLVISRAPQLVHLAVDLHEHLVEVPSPAP